MDRLTSGAEPRSDPDSLQAFDLLFVLLADVAVTAPIVHCPEPELFDVTGVDHVLGESGSAAVFLRDQDSALFVQHRFLGGMDIVGQECFLNLDRVLALDLCVENLCNRLLPAICGIDIQVAQVLFRRQGDNCLLYTSDAADE